MAEPEARLLVVDDEPDILELLSVALRFHGFEVDTAASGRQALAAARASPPDLVVLDVMMPELDGFEVVRRLRGEGLRVPVLFLTARDGTEDKIAGLTLGGDDYVTSRSAWRRSWPASGRSYVSYLRRKVDTTQPRLLHTLRGVGYVLRVPRGTGAP